MVDRRRSDEKRRNRPRQVDLSLKKLDLDLDLKTRSNTKPSKRKLEKPTEKIPSTATRRKRESDKEGGGGRTLIILRQVAELKFLTGKSSISLRKWLARTTKIGP
jgi:hypothetical protein